LGKKPLQQVRRAATRGKNVKNNNKNVAK